MRRKRIAAFLVVFFHVLGALTSVKAIMDTRTAQGAIAWAVSLNTMPYVAVPAYWVFGRSDFKGYVTARRSHRESLVEFWKKYEANLQEKNLVVPDNHPGAFVATELSKLPITSGNHAELLINGEQAFPSIFEGIARAQKYVLVQFYIIRDDEVGRKLRAALIERAGHGVKCYVLYDEVGSHLTDEYKKPLEDAGVSILPFNTTQGWANRFQLNFRNHRKIVVVDGLEAWVGGLNVGREYLGEDPKIGYWRDTHMHMAGPIVQSVQVSFVEGWHWADKRVLENLNWEPHAAQADHHVNMLCMPTGPVDPLETCTLFFLHVINSAKERLWIATPYFVPDQQFISALQLAALRGVDVRLIIPEKADSLMVDLSAWSFLPELQLTGIKVYHYQKGLMHHKITVVDDRYCTIGTANFDNRSFRLNFEITMGVEDEQFASQVVAMLENDLKDSKRVEKGAFEEKSYWFRFWSQVSRLAAPVQ